MSVPRLDNNAGVMEISFNAVRTKTLKLLINGVREGTEAVGLSEIKVYQ